MGHSVDEVSDLSDALTDDLECALLRGLCALAVGGGAGVLAGVLPRHLRDEEGAVVEGLMAAVLG